MIFNKKTWKNREVEFPGRRTLTSAGENVYDVTRSEGLILEEGDAFDATNMNDLEVRIETGMGAVAAKYTGKFTLDGWVASTSEEQAAGYTLAQEVTLTAVTPGAPTVTEDSEFLTGCGYDPTGVAETDEILDEVLAIVNTGCTSSLDGGKIRTIVKEKPAADIVLHWVIRTEVDDG